MSVLGGHYRMTKRRALPSGCVGLKPAKGAPLEEWIMPIPETGCHLWLGAVNDQGYGQRRIDGRTSYVHRIVAEQRHGPLGADEIVMHTCDTPSCCNPDHLVVGSMRDNTHDMLAKERDRIRGERNYHCKLTTNQVNEIQASNMPRRELAARYNISYSHACAIKRKAFRVHG